MMKELLKNHGARSFGANGRELDKLLSTSAVSVSHDDVLPSKAVERRNCG
jgi:hypothetical protein